MRRRVAIIGCSLRIPGSSTSSFWQDLIDKRDLVTEVDPTRWSVEHYLHPAKEHPGSSYTFAAGSLGDLSLFDAGFFGLSPREVSQMDPQQRLLLEMSWESMESAGIPPSSLRGSHCGVFIGIASVDYGYRLADDLSAIDTSTGTGTAPSIASNRISYFFDLHGPSISMDTACSSSLVAFHQACRSILSGETEMALTGGISLHLHPIGFIVFSKANMLSRKGRCRVFDESGDGYVRSEGGGVFLLKEYHQALADGDPILAVVANSAVNTDGSKSGLTVPNVHAQISLMRRTYDQAGISPDQIDYIEAHGTGTAVGDPIEARAIGEALGKRRESPLPIGSVKSNLGHLETASGVAGLAKALYSIQHRALPATIGITRLNPHIHFEEWNIEVVTDTRSLPQSGRIIIGVNSFGFGGANAHVILESPPESEALQAATHPAPQQAIPLHLSARSDAALRSVAAGFADFLTQTEPDFYATAWSAHYRREQHSRGLLIYARSRKEAVQALTRFAKTGEAREVYLGDRIKGASLPAFVYSGNGCQWERMGKRLLAESETFRQTITVIDRLFAHFSDYSLLKELTGANGPDRFAATEIAQPALFALQVGITMMLRERGVEAAAVVGHSVGEVAAAWACGALSLADAVEVIYFRSQFQGRTAGQGEMTAVNLGTPEMLQLLQQPEFDQVCLAGSNSSRGVTLAGPADRLTRVEMLLERRSITFKRLRLNYAFHSPSMDPIKEGLISKLAGIKPQAEKIPFISTVSGKSLPGSELTADYWWRNVRKRVRFKCAVDRLIENGINTFVEIGAHPVLRGYLNDSLRDHQVSGAIIGTLERGKDDRFMVDGAAARVLLTGAPLDYRRWFPSAGKFVPLPTYPWQREAYWHPVSSQSQGLLARHYEHPLLGYRLRQQQLTWESELDTQRHPWLADHLVGDGVVFPGAGFVELALAAAASWVPTETIDLEQLEILSPLLLSDQPSKLLRLSIAAENGLLKVTSREISAADEWTQHLRGRVIRESAGLSLRRRAPTPPDRAPDFTLQQHIEMAAEIGLEYGPAFQAISHGWIDADSVIGIYTLSEPINQVLPHYLLHPGVLDSAFQLFIQLLRSELQQHQGIAFIPTQIGRIQLNSAQAGKVPALAHIRQCRRSPHSLLAEVELYDTDGETLCVLQEVRFKAVPLRRKREHRISFLDYHLTPWPLPDQQITPDLNLTERLHSLRQRCQDEPENGYTDEVEPLLDSLIHSFVLRLLENYADEAGLLSHLPNTAAMDQLLKSAAEDDLVQLEETGSMLLKSRNEVEPETIWNLLLREHQDYFALLQLAGRFGLHLEKLVVSPKGCDEFSLDQRDFSQLLKAQIGAARLSLIEDWLAETVHWLFDRLANGQRLSVLEIAADQPLFGSQLCQQLDFNVSDYTFASPYPEALSEAGILLEHFPLARVEALTLDNSSAVKTTRIEFAQLTLIHLDFLRLNDLQQLLALMHDRLPRGAKIVLLGQHPAYWIERILTLRQNEHSDQGSLHLVGIAQLQALLSDLGYQNIHRLNLQRNDTSGSVLLYCEVPETRSDNSRTNPSDAASLLLRGDAELEQRVARQIGEQLQARGEKVLYLHASTDEIAAQLAAAEKTLGQIDRILMLQGLEGVSPVADQLPRCELAAALLSACEKTGNKAQCWLFTQNVACMFDRSSSLQTEDSSLPPTPDAVLWGFARTLMNEFSVPTLRLLDLPTLSSHHLPLQLIVDTLLSADDEQEIAISADGIRRATRLRFDRPPNLLLQTPGENRSLALKFQLPGQLRNLRWDPVTQSRPAAQQVAVEVKATGLNFRDVMYTLGLLSDEAVENGFAGPTLGLEFAGRIVEIGEGVTGYSVGDEVVGFGPSSFSTRLLASVSTLAKIPQGVSFEAAATIPTTFFTVYYALKHLARLEPGERILIHGAAGGVGIAAIQVARWLGAEIHATVGSREKRDFLQLLGITRVYDSRSLTYAEELLANTPDHRGVDVVLNSLAGEAINQNLRVLKPFGRFMELGKRDFYENTAIGLRPFRNNISYFGIDSDQLMQERPALTQQLFHEMMDLFASGELYPLPYTRFCADQAIEAFRFMQQARQIGKVVIGYQPPPRPPLQEIVQHRTLSLPADATYLITGGLGGFGLRTAEWLVEKGARHLVLISRSGPTNTEAQLAIEQFTAGGVTVLARACDVTDRAALGALLDECAEQLPRLRGIFHAATVIDDGLAVNLSAGQIRRVLEPKITGALNLHELTRDLDLFVLFSSATTLFGNPGQSSYVAANHWLEALAMYRYQRGEPATCVRWGPIDDVGFLARNKNIKESLQGRMGGSALHSSEALNLLEQILISGSPVLGVMELEWSVLSRFLPTAASPKFNEIAALSDEVEFAGDSRAELEEMLRTLSPEELLQAVAEMLRSDLSTILLIPEEKIDIDRSVFEMGVDSLMGVELITAIESRFNIQLPVMVLSEVPTLRRLAEKLLARLQGVESDDQASAITEQQMAALHGVEMDHLEES